MEKSKIKIKQIPLSIVNNNLEISVGSLKKVSINNANNT